MNSVFKTMAKLTALFGVLSLALPLTAQAESAKAEKEISPLVYEPSLENQRNPNEYCAKCHKFDHPGSNVEQDMSVSGGQFHFGKFHGTHLSKTNPSTGKPITCVSCHGNITENHRRGAKDVMRFEGDIFSNKKPMYSAQEQNQVCFSCHQPDKLREKLWAHDVHAMKLPCASCHTLHPKTDAMEKIQPKERVTLCVDCHGEQQKRKVMLQSNTTSEQKDKK